MKRRIWILMAVALAAITAHRGAAATVSIDRSVEYQTIEGFGAFGRVEQLKEHR